MSNPEYTKHKVATDALETLGMLIPEGSGRDAIHLAVEPVICGPRALMPGARIKLATGRQLQGQAIPAQITLAGNGDGPKDDATGIVDPFLSSPVKPGQRFWFVVLPRTITSLRHVWSHPSFPEEKPFHADSDDEHYFGDDPKERAKAMSTAWLKDVIANNDDFRGMTPEEFIGAADRYINSGDFYYGPKTNTFSGGESLPDGFWDHYQNITGREVRINEREDFFTCSC